MNKLEFGEVIFGGNLKANLKVEANMNRTIIREKYKRSKAQSGMLSMQLEQRDLEQDVGPQPLRKHVPKKPKQPLNTVFTKVPPVQLQRFQYRRMEHIPSVQEIL